METSKPIKISTVIPVYSGKEFLEKLFKELLFLREKWKKSDIPLELIEAIFIDDASFDGSAEILETLRKNNDWIQILTLSRNYGQHPATAAGILHTCGDWIFTIDEDLQHDPQYFERFLMKAVAGGFDIVYAKPEGMVHQSAIRDYCSRFYKKFLCKITGNLFITSFNSFRLIRGSIARGSASICSHETYFDIALCWFSNRISSLPLPLKDLRFIQSKKSGYNLTKLFAHARRLMLSSPANILRTGAFIGVLATIASIVLTLVKFYQKFFDPATIQVKGWASIFFSVLFFGGLSAFLLGVVLEYVTNMLLHAHGKPPFFIVNRSLDTILREYFDKENVIDVPYESD